MRNTFAVIGIFIALISFLVFIFWGVNLLQQKHIKTQSTSINQNVPPQEEATTMPKITTFDIKIVFSFIFPDKKLETDPIKIAEYSPNTFEITKIDYEMLKNIVDSLPEISNNFPQVPATVERSKKGLITRVIRGTPHKLIDRVKTFQLLSSKVENLLGNVKSSISDSISNPLIISIIVPLKYNDAVENVDSLRLKLGFKECIAEFETKHDEEHSRDENRNKNLQIACEKIDGLILHPGETFSFNKVVGPRTRKQGFLPAGVISNGKVIPGLGGGVCQVSTTLYRCALLSGLKIVERHNHSIYEGISYAERGLDAAVVYGVKDFRFINSIDVPILILCEAGQGLVKVQFYAEKKPFENVEIVTRNEVKIPFEVQIKRNPYLRVGERKVIQPGVTGYKIEAYRIVTIKGIKKEELLSQDNYLTFPRIEEVNN